MTGGLLVSGRLAPVAGLRITPPASAGGPPYAALAPGDYRQRRSWIRQVILHTTKGTWPQPILLGTGPGGSAKVVADFWRDSPIHSGAHLVVDTDGSVLCLADLKDVTAYHAEMSNDWSVGIEMYQVANGGVYQATIDAAVTLTVAVCELVGIPLQVHHAPYLNKPLARMELGEGKSRRQIGGPDCVGIFGHRDNTSERGRGDPGDAIYTALVAAGAEAFNYGAGEDVLAAKLRQQTLVGLGADVGGVDGLVGPRSMAAARRLGFKRWRDVPTSA